MPWLWSSRQPSNLLPPLRGSNPLHPQVMEEPEEDMPAARARSFAESVAMADSGSLAGASVEYSDDVFDEADADTGAARRRGGEAASASEVDDYDDDDGAGARSVLRGMDELDSMQVVEEDGAEGGASATGMASESTVGRDARRSASASGSAALELQVRLRGSEAAAMEMPCKWLDGRLASVRDRFAFYAAKADVRVQRAYSMHA